ncbi:hypothetical protein [uncultured Agrococcus sp.]|uniref:hypothetical protein n=1 Tax=uncultured Agrococcus sp. TaxID=382258 RepID=UPI0025E7AC3A|nr:hypothetical protein [uncultured Agrococcus sp.]
MIATLLKHEFIRTRGMLAAILGIGVLLTVVGTLMTATGWIVIAELGSILAFIVISVLVPALQIGLAFDFWFSSFRRTGYFTQTLPIKGSTIYWSKALWGTLITIAGLGISVLLSAMFWAALGPSMMMSGNLFAEIGALADFLPTGPAVAIVAFVVISYVGWLMQLLFAATIGSGKALGRLSIGGPIIVYLVAYTISQIILLLGLLLIPLAVEVTESGARIIQAGLLSEMLTELQLSSAPTESASGGTAIVPLGFIPPMLLIYVVSIWWSVRNWNKKIALA